MRQDGGRHLERLCGDRIRLAPSSPGLERGQAFFARQAFAPHRHDTYAIGSTQRGVQSFRYRGQLRHSLAGQVFVLHPDELHDGRPGSEAGYGYRILYIEPRLIGDALEDQGAALPFLRDPVTSDTALRAALMPALDDPWRPLPDLLRDEVIAGVAQALAMADPSRRPAERPKPYRRGMALLRELLDAQLAREVSSAEIEAVTGLSRYAVLRHFRACLGTTPHRYLLMRRLDRARMLIRRGEPLAQAGLASGFADQSHMTRHFTKAYGMPPGRWARLLG